MKTKLSRFAAVLAAAALLVTAISCKTPEDATVEKETAATPVITVADNSVTITCATEGATIYYTTDGSDPTADSSVYSSPIALTETVTVKAFAAADGYDDSETAEKECEYVKPVTATPVITDSDNTVTITCETEDAVIYYTTDGTDPTAESTKYEAAFPVTASVTVKAIATKAGYTDSEVASAEVEYVAPGTVGTPKITQDGNTVTITCATTGATIYYTTDGSEPTTASTKYTAAITLTKDITIKAFAVKADCTDSAVATQSCTYVIPKVTVKFMNGTTEVDSKTINSGAKVTAPAAPEKTGYTFGGWKAGTVTLAASAESAAITADTTFEAVWTPITYTIKFDANGGSGEVSSITATYDKDVTLPENAFTLPEATETITYLSFRSWNTGSNGSGTNYASGASVKNLAATAGAEVTLYAQWNIYALLWSGSNDLGTEWDGGATLGIEASKFENITTSDVIAIYGTVGDEGYHQLKICSNGEGWAALSDLASTLGANEYNCVSFAGVLKFSLSETDLAIVKENGLRIAGYDATITTVKLYVEKDPVEIVAEADGYTSYSGRGLSELDGYSDSAMYVMKIVASEEGCTTSGYGVGALLVWAAGWSGAATQLNAVSINADDALVGADKETTVYIPLKNIKDAIEAAEGTDKVGYGWNIWADKSYTGTLSITSISIVDIY